MGAKSGGFGWLWIVGLLAVLVFFKLVGMGVQSAAVQSVAPSNRTPPASMVREVERDEPQKDPAIIDPFRPNPFAKYVQGDCKAGFRSTGTQCFKICPEGYHATAAGVDRCEKDISRFVDRGLFGRCPAGYVDHPANPKECTLPIIAERMIRR